MIAATLGAREVGPERVGPGGRIARPPAVMFDFVLLALAGLPALQPLAVAWQSDFEYSFGWMVPVLAAFLFFEAWRLRPSAEPAGGSYIVLVGILLLWALACVATLVISSTVPGWRPAWWLAASLYLAAVLAWCGLRGGWGWVRHFAFPVAFIFCAVPWLYNLEVPLEQTLMRGNAMAVADSLLLADIPASAAGNTIQLTTGQLGIEEACSGVRSLQASVMTALFLGGLLRFRAGRLVLMVTLGIVFALLGNYLRLLVLAWHGAAQGPASIAALHDSAGLMVFALSMAMLVLSSRLLAGVSEVPKTRGAAQRLVSPPTTQGTEFARTWAVGVFLAAIASSAVATAWMHGGAHPSTAVLIWRTVPAKIATDYRPIPLPPATHDLLRDAQSRAGTWSDARGRHWTEFWFRYGATPENRLAADLHNPRVCLSAAGLRLGETYPPVVLPGAAHVPPISSYRFTGSAGELYVFWLSTLASEANGTAAASPEQVVYGRGFAPLFARIMRWTGAAWRGGAPAPGETWEVGVSGCRDSAEARHAFLDLAGRCLADGPPAR